MDEARKIINDIEYGNDPYDTASESDALLILTSWKEFREVDLKRLKSIMKRPIIIDGVNILDPHKVKEMGFIYKGIGRR
jgi:UDPglucose 6-dehydrogenase